MSRPFTQCEFEDHVLNYHENNVMMQQKKLKKNVKSGSKK